MRTSLFSRLAKFSITPVTNPISGRPLFNTNRAVLPLILNNYFPNTDFKIKKKNETGLCNEYTCKK